MKDFVHFMFEIADELYDLFAYTRRAEGADDPELEKQLAMRIVRKSAEERARRAVIGQ